MARQKTSHRWLWLGEPSEVFALPELHGGGGEQRRVELTVEQLEDRIPTDYHVHEPHSTNLKI